MNESHDSSRTLFSSVILTKVPAMEQLRYNEGNGLQHICPVNMSIALIADFQVDYRPCHPG